MRPGLLLAAFTSLALLLGVMPAGAQTQPPGADAAAAGPGLDYNLDRVRQAQQAAAEAVGLPPPEVAEYFSDKGVFFAHPRNPELVGQGPEVLHMTLEDFPRMREELRRYLAIRYRTMAAQAAAVGEPLVFKIPVLMFGIHNDVWQEDSTPEKFEAQLSGIETSDTGTVTEMYLEQSFGNIVIDMDVYGPYQSVLANGPQNDAGVCYYGTDGAPVTGDQLGLGGLGARGMAEEAVPMSDPDVDYGQYDNDLDGWLDFLVILHSGPDAAATGNECHVWSHYFGSIAGEPTTTTQDTNAEGEPVMVGPVLTIPEVDLQIGVTAHEIMHALGEPDYYGTAGTAGTGDWDLGAGGSWLGIPTQTNPVHFNPVMKINFGWLQPRVITETTRDVALLPRANHPEVVMVPLVVAKADSDAAALCDQGPVGIPSQNNAFYTEDGDCLVEGFLLENINRASAAWDEASCLFTPSDFDRQVYASGLMVWHWDFTNYVQLGNNNILRPMLDVEEFDRRDAEQDQARDITRAQPLDLFWGDPVGLTGATQIAPEGAEIAPPEGSPWTVTAAPGAGAEGTEATPIPEWEAAAVPEGVGMTVTLSWDVETDDWDLYVDRMIDGEWVEVRSSAGGAPQTQESVTILDYAGGDQFRARAYNWLGPTSPQAEVSVGYEFATATQLGPVGTRDNDLEQTGWAFTNLRPSDYRGLTHAAEQPRTPIMLDLVRHDDTTVDVSGDFLTVDRETPAPLIAGEAVTLVTNVYNHGGAAVTGATFSLYDADPASGAEALDDVTMDLGPFARAEASFSYTPQPGSNELYVVASADGDVTPGNDVVRTELDATAPGAAVLIVDDDFGWTFEEPYEAALNALGVPYAVVEGEPAAELLAGYDAVIWLTTTVSGAQGVLSDAARETIAAYLDGGGSLWLASTRAAGYVGVNDPDWLAGYFGFAIEQNLLNSVGALVGLGDAIGGDRTIPIGYLDGRPYIDYGTVPAEGVNGTATAVLRHESRPDHVVATKVEGDDGFRTFYGVPIGLLDDPTERLRLTGEVLDFLGVATGAPTAPPGLEVHYERFQHVQIGEAQPITVGALGAGGVDAVRVLHRPYGGQDWQTAELARIADGLWGGAIPGEAIANNGVQYYVEVDVAGTSHAIDGGAVMPHVASAPYGDPAAVDYCGGGPAGARLWGNDRYATAVAISQASYPDDGSAAAAVLARGDDPNGFADALAGTPLAVARDAPLLITLPDRLLGTVEQELVRVLPDGATVYLLGGEQALAPGIEQRLNDLGFQTQRIAGPTRIETAIAIAGELGDPATLMITTGDTFPDALAAGAAAAHGGGAVLLTPSEQRHPATDAYLQEHAEAARYAVGGPAARPYPDATAVFGETREGTAVAVAEAFFDQPAAVGLAVRSKFPDSLTGGAHIARLGGPVLLTPTDALDESAAGYLCGLAGTVEQVFTYGGTLAISEAVSVAALARAAGEGC